MLLTSLIKLSKEWFKQSEALLRLSKLEEEKVNMELRTLKSQLHPHFLFNSLNSIYSLALQGSTDTPNVILDLSDVFRYMIYETRDTLVDLTKELSFLKRFIELQRIRSDSKEQIKFELEGDPDNIRIAPLIFLPFVENSFKHGFIGDSLESEIIVKLRIKPDKRIILFVRNKKSDEKIISSNKGIGLENVRKRLQLQYPYKHILEIKDTDNEYIVNLEIQCE
jgi:LytS/YehU family sensor histidine kinase